MDRGDLTVEDLARMRPDVLIIHDRRPTPALVELCVNLGRNLGSGAAIAPWIVVVDTVDPAAIPILLDAGVDDVVSSAIDARELAARIRAISRRRSGTLPAPVATQLPGAFLTRAESQLFRYLLDRAGQIVPPEELSEQVLGRVRATDMSLVRVHLGNLRKKLGTSRAALVTVRGRGYVLDAAAAAGDPTGDSEARAASASGQRWKTLGVR